MSKKYKKVRPVTPGWVDTLITWLEVLGAIATVLFAIYTLVTWLM